MKRNHLNLTIDVALGVLGIGLVSTGLLLWLVLPAGSRGATVWGWTRHDWGDLHGWIAVTLLGLIVLHLALHWGWLWATCARVLGRPAAGRLAPGRRWLGAGVLATIVLGIIGFLWVAAEAKTHDESGGRWRGGRHVEAPTPIASPQASSASEALDSDTPEPSSL